MAREIVCISPVDGTEYLRRPTASAAEIAAALAAARAAQKDWRRRPVGERAAIVVKLIDAFEAMGPALGEDLTRQMGRPIRYGLGELRGSRERAEHMARIAPEALAPVVPPARPGFERFVTREPVSIVFTVAPWNYPYLTTVNSVVPALIAGNAVILKHAAQTLGVGDRFQAAFDATDLPKGLFQHLVLDHEQTLGLISGGHVDHVAFTGSVEAGRTIERACGGTFTTCGLELGGKDPAYVRPDADFDHTIEQLVDGAFFNAGQCCCGIERIYVHAAVHDRFLDAYTAAVSRYVLADPLDPATTLGPMARTAFAETVRAQTAEAVAKGARALIDPKLFPASKAGTPYLMPQVLTGVDHAMTVMCEESFGPVVGIMKVADDAEAVRLMNDSRYGLTASIWTSDVAAVRAIDPELDFGTVFMNRCDYVDPGLVWTGVKDTGRGAALSAVGYETLTRPKSHHYKLTTP
ncbi:MAG: aldehyde dehydrogenase family protein [Phyllobacteriaceae bacterium]|nr:aldehyde dehydrogenase family protein [Phyllobacteriaceae bacterium]